MTTAAAAIGIGRWCIRCRITRSPLHHHPAIGTTAHRMLRSFHLGDVVEESDGDLMVGVNIAARLEGSRSRA
jgi:hypothetical protein